MSLGGVDCDVVAVDYDVDDDDFDDDDDDDCDDLAMIRDDFWNEFQDSSTGRRSWPHDSGSKRKNKNASFCICLHHHYTIVTSFSKSSPSSS